MCDPTDHVTLVDAHEDKCNRFIQSNEQLTYSEVEKLTCDHEEADTRMIAHAKHASLFYHNIVIKSPDTDVFFIALNACLHIMHCLGDPWCSSLLGLHAFTGWY